MNELENSYLAQQYPTFVAIFVILVIVIAVLSTVVIIQNRKHAQLLKPKYGFLGKPLAAMFFLVLAVGSVSLVYYSTKNSQDVGNVSADRQLTLQIKETLIENNIYRLNLIPTINSDLWGTVEDTFDVYWTISNSQSFTRIELKLNESSQGGIVLELRPGRNTVKAVVFTGSISKEITKEITL